MKSVAGRFVLARPLRLLTLVVTRRDERGRPIDLDGLAPDDREVLRWLQRTTRPIDWPELLARAEDAGYAVLIRSDLPRIE